jgi:hypothetical protein
MKANVFAGHPEYFSSAITSTSRIANIFIGREQTKFIYKLLNETPKEEKYGHKTYLDSVVQADTDSVAYDSLIYVNGESIKIGDLYENTDGIIEKRGKHNYIKHLDNELETLSFNTKTETIESKKIKYIMAHKVKKRMYKIKYKDTYIKVTEDHSIIIKRGDEYLDVAPKDIIKGDCIIKI